MRKREIRRASINQLRREKKILGWIVFILMVIAIVSIIISPKYANNPYDIYMLCMVWVAVIGIVNWLRGLAAEKIKQVENMLINSNIKALIELGKAEQHIYLKDERIQNSILSKNIRRIELKQNETFEDFFIMEIYLRGMVFPMNISKECVLSLLDKADKKVISKKVIDSIIIDEANKKVQINTRSGYCAEIETNGDNLYNWFELRK